MLNEAAAAPAAPSTKAPSAAGGPAPPHFGTGSRTSNLSTTGAGVTLSPPPSLSPVFAPLASSPASSSSDEVVSRKLTKRPKITSASVEASLALVHTTPPSKESLLPRSELRKLELCDCLYAAEDGYWRACLKHTDLGAEFSATLESHEVVISFVRCFGKWYPALFTETNGRVASLYRAAACAIVPRDERENTRHHLNSPSKSVARPDHVAKRNKRALVRLKGVPRSEKLTEEQLSKAKRTDRFELMAEASGGSWLACSANVKASRTAKLGPLQAGHMWIRWSNHRVAAWPVNKVSDLDRSLLGKIRKPLGPSRPLPCLICFSAWGC